MKAKELIQALSELSKEEQELEVYAQEEIWLYLIKKPRICFIDDECVESQHDGEKIISLA